MIVDCHVHVCATVPGRGKVSESLRRSLVFRFMRWRLGLKHEDGDALDRELEAKLAETVDQTPALDAVVVLAFDAVYRRDGRVNEKDTHLQVTNDYVLELTARHPKFLFGASVNPYRPDAVKELERCIERGAVLLKWLPVVQDFDPSDERCLPLFDVLAHHKIPLLCHTGGERSLPCLNFAYADPVLLLPALRRGVTVIAAHCGTRSTRGETDFLPTFLRMARDHENLYGDTAGLNLPTRSYAYAELLADKQVLGKLVHGSDWPIPSFPPARHLGWRNVFDLMHDKNWLRRDVVTKQRLGLDSGYWERAGKLLRLPSRPAVAAGPAGAERT
jgi:predicted TIM-barrel fold metal-dependent hydrolase